MCWLSQSGMSTSTTLLPKAEHCVPHLSSLDSSAQARMATKPMFRLKLSCAVLQNLRRPILGQNECDGNSCHFILPLHLHPCRGGGSPTSDAVLHLLPFCRKSYCLQSSCKLLAMLLVNCAQALCPACAHSFPALQLFGRTAAACAPRLSSLFRCRWAALRECFAVRRLHQQPGQGMASRSMPCLL